MKSAVVAFILFSLSISARSQYDPSHNNSRKFILQSEFPENFNLTNASIQVEPFDNVFNDLKESAGKETSIAEKSIRWEIENTGINWINPLFINPGKVIWYLAEPGDSINVNMEGARPFFSGKGAASWDLIYTVQQLEDSLDMLPERRALSSRYYPPTSRNDYYAWSDFLNKKAAIILKVIEQYKSEISDLAYKSIKERFLLSIEKRRIWKFNFLRDNNNFSETNQYGLSNKDICNIYDSTMLGPYANWLLYNEKENLIYHYPLYWWEMLKLELYRKKARFFRTSEDEPKLLGNRPEDTYINIYALAKKKYTGIKREKIIAFTFFDPKGIFDAIGFTYATDSLLKKYYLEPGFERFKDGVKLVEDKFRKKAARLAAPAFTLKDRYNALYSSEKLQGKLVVIDFWFTGCKGCVQLAPELRKVEEHFSNDTNVVFLSVSIDKDKKQWEKSIREGIYTTGTGTQLYTGGQGNTHEIIEKFYVTSYPTLVMIDPYGKIIPYNSTQIDPRHAGSTAMIKKIRYQLAICKDGPYVLYPNQDSTTVYEFRNGVMNKETYSSGNLKWLYATSDENTTFDIQLKKSLSIEPSVYAQPEKLFVLSDIEGNFDAFRKLLVRNQIIDSQFNWTFGNGHLVFAGDMFDRGVQVTECLWLMYSLEEKAKASGGYVHFILGNHEIMNLQGDQGYVIPKYIMNASMIGKSIKTMYGWQSELGKWLRTKNVVEKIGSLLVLHGGVSPEINNMPLSIEEINLLCRSCYDCHILELKEKFQKPLLRGESSPFWYRGYYSTEINSRQVDSTLQKFKVQHIITGHTVIADTISIHHDGKIINTDTRHAEGKSEALLILDGVFYRVNQEGTRIRLYTPAGK